ncbi:putative short-chain dehydrogenase [Hyaloscypha finlandica]|nr:putative short-chain dehydrogenase [Hyaloscypha finlandica]
MPATSPVILILGAGPNVGSHVAKAFASKGYKVALAARKAKEADNTSDQVNIPSDLSDPNSVLNAFSKVKALLGLPSVVVYNAGAVTMNDAKNPLSLPLADFTRDFIVNTTSAFVAAQQAVLAFEQLPESASKTFIYTGNITNVVPLAPLLDLGVGKSATAHIIQSAAAAYKDRGFKFYYGDERKADGSAAFMDIDGDAHGKMYLELAEGKEQGPWQQTFVKNVGYKNFA